MERNNVSKNKILNELAGNFVQAQEKKILALILIILI